MKKKLINLIEIWILTALVLFTTSCSVQKRIKKCQELLPQVTDTITQTQIETIKEETYIDVPYYIPADTSAWVKALIECDSLGRAKIKEIEKQNGKRSNINTTLKDNVFKTKCNCDAIKDSLQTVITNITKKQSSTNTIVRPCPQNKATWWQKTKQDFGGYAIILWIILILVLVGWRLLKAFIKANVPIKGLRW